MSTSILDDDTAMFAVVVNHEEQYSIWPADREVPTGWRAQGTSGTRAACLARIAELWTDMRPLGLRERMARTGG
jgi:MbtH protein